MSRIIECVPNFSEGRSPQTVDAIAAPFRHRKGVSLLDVQTDADHNRMVVTVIGSPEAVAAAMLDAMEQAVARIDMRQHQGQHPRMGAVDVVPFIPVRDMSMDEAVAVSTSFGRRAAERFDVPIILYGRSASGAHRTDLTAVRNVQFEGMAAKLTDPLWRPDFGPASVHATAGVTAVGARPPLVAFNVNLGTADPAIADAIAKTVRFSGGGLRYCKAMGVSLEDRGIVQVSMNMTDVSQTALYRAVEMIRFEARRYGVPVVGSEIVGLVPLQALIDSAAHYLGLEEFRTDQVLETHLF